MDVLMQVQTTTTQRQQITTEHVHTILTVVRTTWRVTLISRRMTMTVRVSTVLVTDV